MVRVFSVFTLIFILTYSTAAQDISVKASVDKKEYKVGDYINYSIQVSSDKKLKIVQPSIKDSLSGIELITVKPAVTEEKDNKKISTFNFIVSKYDSGDAIIPNIIVKYLKGKDTLTAATNEVHFTVHTLKVNQQADIKDVKEPIKIPVNWKLVLIFVLIGLLVVGALVYAYLYYRKKRAIKKGIIKVIEKEPHEIALESLKSLEEKKLWQQGLIKQYHSEVTEIIRRYFEERFEIPALEITTGELLNNLEKVNEAKNIRQIVSDFLNNADLVKFAKYVPMNSINEEMMKQAYQIVNETIPEPEAEVPQETNNVQ